MVDVSMSMMRMILAVRGHSIVAASIGFVEVLIWLVAIGKALEHMSSIYHVLGYAGGFAVGNYLGVWLEERFALGTNVVHAVLRRAASGAPGGERAVAAAERLREEGFAVTQLEGLGRHSSVDILNVVIARRNAGRVVAVIREVDPEAFISIEEVRTVQGGHIQPAARKVPFLSNLSMRRPQAAGPRALFRSAVPPPGPAVSERSDVDVAAPAVQSSVRLT